MQKAIKEKLEQWNNFIKHSLSCKYIKNPSRIAQKNWSILVQEAPSHDMGTRGVHKYWFPLEWIWLGEETNCHNFVPQLEPANTQLWFFTQITMSIWQSSLNFKFGSQIGVVFEPFPPPHVNSTSLYLSTFKIYGYRMMIFIFK